MPEITVIPSTENQYIEFKREETSAQTLAEEIVAFANGEGGEIWLGVDDQGYAVGLTRLFQSAGLFHYDIVEVGGAQLKHLNQSAITDYFSRYHIDYLSEDEQERQRLLAASDIASERLIPTVGGLLVFGIAPERHLHQSGIAFAVFNGTEINSSLRDKKNLFGGLPMQVDNALAAIKANIPVPSEIEGTKRVDKPGYPDKVFRELLVNACVHRNYSIIGSQIRVFLFDDRIEFISPGRLPNTVKVSKLTTGTSFSRNPLLVRLMENLGYMDKLGRGLPMVYQEAKKLGKTVQFIDDGEEFRVIVEL